MFQTVTKTTPAIVTKTPNVAAETSFEPKRRPTEWRTQRSPSASNPRIIAPLRNLPASCDSFLAAVRGSNLVAHAFVLVFLDQLDALHQRRGDVAQLRRVRGRSQRRAVRRSERALDAERGIILDRARLRYVRARADQEEAALNFVRGVFLARDGARERVRERLELALARLVGRRRGERAQPFDRTLRLGGVRFDRRRPLRENVHGPHFLFADRRVRTHAIHDRRERKQPAIVVHGVRDRDACVLDDRLARRARPHAPDLGQRARRRRGYRCSRSGGLRGDRGGDGEQHGGKPGQHDGPFDRSRRYSGGRISASCSTGSAIGASRSIVASACAVDDERASRSTSSASAAACACSASVRSRASSSNVRISACCELIPAIAPCAAIPAFAAATRARVMSRSARSASARRRSSCAASSSASSRVFNSWISARNASTASCPGALRSYDVSCISKRLRAVSSSTRWPRTSSTISSWVWYAASTDAAGSSSRSICERASPVSSRTMRVQRLTSRPSP